MSQFPGLEPVLNPHSELTINEEDRIVQHIVIHNGSPQMIAQERFSRNEWHILLPLLQAYPGYVAYETLLAALRGVSLSTAQQQLEEARRTRTVRQELKAVRNAIDHIDAKLSSFSLTLVPIHTRGYTLALLKEEIHGNSPSSSVI